MATAEADRPPAEPHSHSPGPSPRGGFLAWWNGIPLYWRILVAMLIGLPVGLLLGAEGLPLARLRGLVLAALEYPSRVILQLLGALAPPLILIAVTHVLMTTDVSGKKAARLAGLLLINTLVAIGIGLAVANTIQPGRWWTLDQPESKEAIKGLDPLTVVLDNIPRSLLGPLGDRQNIIGVILIAIAFGIALRSVKDRKLARDVVELAYELLVKVLHWIINLVPIGVFAIVAFVIGTKGVTPFKSLGAFIIAVIVALLLQTCWYLLRIKFFSWPRPFAVLRGMRDALVMAFSTGSSTATMPVTYTCLKEKVGLREESASMGSLVGANFNNDGTALYEAMAALFVAQLLGQHLSFFDQLLVVLTSVVASVGAAGIPEAGIVTMTLVFTAVGLPTTYIALLLPVDWFLDRCRTTVNVLGDVNVSCLLDGKTRSEPVRPATETSAA
jgi:DAACS family dicarboxylate/amino acid:cation (Na+ or H+) symporter